MLPGAVERSDEAARVTADVLTTRAWRTSSHLPRANSMTMFTRAMPSFGHARLLHSAEETHLMGMPALHPPVTTIEELLALPEDGLRHELLDGVHVVTPAPSLLHQRAVRGLLAHLLATLADRDDAEPLTSPADIVLSPRTLVQPDVFVVRRVPGQRLQRWADVGVPLLATEILSPKTAPRDRGAKRRIYQGAGVAEYWIVDLDARLIERWRPQDTRPEIADQALEWSLPGGATGRLNVRQLLAQIWEDAK
jgi:Uma2 family endonuclease